ncbi:MAG: peptidylprolyl isomerase [Vulcanimicrobiaceae bacterium]
MSYRSTLIAALCSSLLGLAVAGCSGNPGSAAASTGGPVASVNGSPIPRGEYISRLEALPQAAQILNQLIQGQLIDQYAQANNVSIPDSAVDAKLAALQKQYPNGQFDMLIKQQHLTLDGVRKLLRQELIVEKAVSDKIKVSNADVATYLDHNHATLDTPAEVRARHILVPDLKTAETVEAKLKAGGNFADLAKQFSTDKATAVNGGELGFFSATQMVPTFSHAAFTQKIGEIGPPVKSPFGFHVIQVEGHKAAQVATMANSADKIKTLLTQQQQQEQIPSFLESLRAKANIQVYDDALKAVLNTPPPLPAPAATVAPAPSPRATK